MRGLLVFLGILVAAVAAALVVLPRVIDEPALRTRLLALAERSIGYRLEIQGEVRLELDPWPRLSVDHVTIIEPGAGRLDADRIDVELALLPLLGARLEPSRVHLVRPFMALERLPDRPFEVIFRSLGRTSGEIRAIELVDGSVDLNPPEGSSWPRQLEGVDASLGWDHERRRFALSGNGLVDEEPLGVDLDLEPVPGRGPMTLRLDLQSPDGESPFAAGFRGSLEPGGRVAGNLRVAAAHGRLPGWLVRSMGTEALPALPGGFTLAARLMADAGELALDSLELGLDGSLLRGEFRLRSAPARHFELDLAGTRATLTPELEQALRDLAAFPRPSGLAGRIELRLASLLWRGDEVRRLHALAELDPGGGLAVPELEATLPGATALRWTGQDAQAGRVVGSVALQAGELRPLLRWLGAGPADIPPGGLTSLDLAAEAEITPGRLELQSIDARLDASVLRGSLALAAGDRPKLALVLTADRLNTALYLPDHLGLDLALWRERLAALDLDLALVVERLSHDRWRGGRASLRAAAEAGRVRIEEALLIDPAGGSVQATGSADLGLPSYELTAELVSNEPEALLRAIGREPLAELDELSPLRLSGRLRGDPDAAMVTADLDTPGLEASLSGSLGGPFDLRYLDLEGEVRADDPGGLVTAFGWALPEPAVLRGGAATRLVLRRQGQAFEARLDGRLGGSELEGRVVMSEGRRPFVDAELASPALETALLGLAYDVLAARLGLPPGRPWQWPGIWPRTPLDWSWLQDVDLRLDLAAAALRHGGVTLPGANAVLGLREGRLSVKGLSLPIAGGTLAGSLSLEHAAAHVLLGADLRLTGARAESLVEALAPGSGLVGELGLGARLLGSGRSIADLVGTLQGEGEVSLRRGRLGGIAFPPLEGGEAALDPGLTIERLEGPLSIRGGVVASAGPGLALDFPSGTAEAHLRLDLLAWLTELELEGHLEDAPASSFGLRLIGAPGRLRPVPPLEPARP